MTVAVGAHESVGETPLWGRPVRLVVGVGGAAGVAIAGLGWWGVSGEATVGHQFHWLAVGVVGVLVCLTAGAAWVFAGMRAVGLRIRAVVPVPSGERAPVRELHVVAAGGAGGPHAAEAGDALVAAAGMRYFHRSSCALARGKNVRPAERAEHVREGRAACGVCRPDSAAGVSAA